MAYEIYLLQNIAEVIKFAGNPVFNDTPEACLEKIRKHQEYYLQDPALLHERNGLNMPFSQSAMHCLEILEEIYKIPKEERAPYRLRVLIGKEGAFVTRENSSAPFIISCPNPHRVDDIKSSIKSLCEQPSRINFRNQKSRNNQAKFTVESYPANVAEALQYIVTLQAGSISATPQSKPQYSRGPGI